VCGRVCKDDDEGKINSTSVILQGSRFESSGNISFHFQIFTTLSLDVSFSVNYTPT